ncbi:anthrax toxin receptor-like [Mustela putorius furo]|uniref:Anthrax toxin receptor-like n=1 Tax=Mustela putorius furo TaxID=9669 RepID=M3YC58_MUSPF|nr:anthrax toxin receptor-like [Mustela putorius furo]
MASTNPTSAPVESGVSGTAKKIGSSSICIPGPALSLFLLLLLPPPLLSTGSFLHHLPAGRSFHHRARHYRNKADLRNCDSAFNIFFLLDASQTAKDYWEESQRLVEEMLKRFTNPAVKISIVTYNSQGETQLPLTIHRKEFEEALKNLKTVQLSGDNLLETGFVKVNEDLRKQHLINPRMNSLIIAVTTAPLKPSSIPMIKAEAKEAQRMKGSLYFMTLNNYDRAQLVGITGRESQVYATKGLKEMDLAYQSLVANTCKKMKSAGVYFVCLFETYDVGFETPVPDPSNIENFVCEYTLDGDPLPNRRANIVTSHSIICPGHIFETEDRELVVRYSMDAGVTFQDSMVFSGTNCEDPLKTAETTTMPLMTTPMMTTNTMTTTWMPVVPISTTTTTQTTTTSTTTTTTTQTTTTTTTTTMTRWMTTTSMTTTQTITTQTVSTTITWERSGKAIVTPESTGAMIVTEKPILDKSLYAALASTLLIIPVVIFGICCCTNTDKEPPPMEIIERESDTCIQRCTPVVIPCCPYEEDMSRIEDKLDTLCDFVQSCRQLPLIWCQPRDQGQCFNFTPLKPLCRQLPCLPPLNSCCEQCQYPPTIYSQPPSMTLPLISPPSEALCRTTLSLPPP